MPANLLPYADDTHYFRPITTGMQMQDDAKTGPIWIRGPELRKRWGNMSNSTFYARLSRGLIPAPEYPFGPTTPYWRLDAVAAFERGAKLRA